MIPAITPPQFEPASVSTQHQVAVVGASRSTAKVPLFPRSPSQQRDLPLPTTSMVSGLEGRMSERQLFCETWAKGSTKQKKNATWSGVISHFLAIDCNWFVEGMGPTRILPFGVRVACQSWGCTYHWGTWPRSALSPNCHPCVECFLLVPAVRPQLLTYGGSSNVSAWRTASFTTSSRILPSQHHLFQDGVWDL